MNRGNRALDITLAIKSRAKYAAMLTREDKRRICSLTSPDELVAFLARTSGWREAMRALPVAAATDEQFSSALDQEILGDFEGLYRMASDTSKDFLSFLTLDAELRAITEALRRLASGAGAQPPDKSAPSLRLLHGENPARLRDAGSFEELVKLCQGSIYGPVLRSLELDKDTGLPAYGDAALRLETEFYRALSKYLRRSYNGPAKKTLIETVSFRADMLNVTYILRLRRFNTTAERAEELLMPLYGNFSPETARVVLAAGSDEEAAEALKASGLGKWFAGLGDAPPEKLVEAAEAEHYRKVIHGPPTLCTVYAYLTLKENEAAMLKRAFVALGYGLSPERYML